MYHVSIEITKSWYHFRGKLLFKEIVRVYKFVGDIINMKGKVGPKCLVDFMAYLPLLVI